MEKRQKRKLILIIGLLSALGPFTIDMYLAGFPSIAADFGVNMEQVALTLTSYFIGISAGQFIYGPLIDRFGRKKPLIIGLIIYSAASLGCALSPDLAALISLRLLQALGGCAGMVIGRAVVRDLFDVQEIVKVFSTLMLVISVSPLIAPTSGAMIAASLGWRYIFVILAIMSAVLLWGIHKFLPESRGADKTVSLKLKSIVKRYWLVLKNRSFLFYALGSGMASAGLFTYVSAASFIVLELLGFSQLTFGYIFGAIAMGLVISSQLNNIILKFMRSEQAVITIGILFPLTGIFILATNFSGSASPWLLLGSIFTYMFWIGIISPNTTALALTPFTENVGSASAMLGGIQMISGSAASVFVSRLHNGTMMPVASVMAGCGILYLFWVILGRFSTAGLNNS